VIQRRHAADFAEKAAFVLSLTQEFMESAQAEWEVWLVSVRAGKVAAVKATKRDDYWKCWKWKRRGNCCSKECNAPTVSAGFRMTDLTERGAYLGILTGLVE